MGSFQCKFYQAIVLNDRPVFLGCAGGSVEVRNSMFYQLSSLSAGGSLYFNSLDLTVFIGASFFNRSISNGTGGSYYEKVKESRAQATCHSYGYAIGSAGQSHFTSVPSGHTNTFEDSTVFKNPPNGEGIRHLALCQMGVAKIKLCNASYCTNNNHGALEAYGDSDSNEYQMNTNYGLEMEIPLCAGLYQTEGSFVVRLSNFISNRIGTNTEKQYSGAFIFVNGLSVTFEGAVIVNNQFDNPVYRVTGGNVDWGGAYLSGNNMGLESTGKGPSSENHLEITSCPMFARVFTDNKGDIRFKIMRAIANTVLITD